MKREKQNVMIAVNPPYSGMIQCSEKKIEFRRKIIFDLHKGDVLWFYETKNKGGTGKIIGYATLVASIPLSAIYDLWGDYSSFINNHILFRNFCFDIGLEIPYDPTDEWVRDIRDKMQIEYLKYSNGNNKEHLKKIGASGNYALLFRNFTIYELPLRDFVYMKSNIRMNRPPQNMCRVKEVGDLFLEREADIKYNEE